MNSWPLQMKKVRARALHSLYAPKLNGHRSRAGDDACSTATVHASYRGSSLAVCASTAFLPSKCARNVHIPFLCTCSLPLLWPWISSDASPLPSPPCTEPTAQIVSQLLSSSAGAGGQLLQLLRDATPLLHQGETSLRCLACIIHATPPPLLGSRARPRPLFSAELLLGFSSHAAAMRTLQVWTTAPHAVNKPASASALACATSMPALSWSTMTLWRPTWGRQVGDDGGGDAAVALSRIAKVGYAISVAAELEKCLLCDSTAWVLVLSCIPIITHHARCGGST